MNIARTIVTSVLRRLPHGSITIVDQHDTQLRFGQGTPSATMVLHSERVWNAFLGGSLKLAEAYFDGDWDSPDLAALVGVAAANIGALDRPRRLLDGVRIPLERYREYRGAHSQPTAQRDIRAHYDLGNQLFGMMLDESLTYSCAYFEHANYSLEDAQRAKLELICEQLNIGADDHVVEIGSGWGSFALHAARTRGCHITTTTISAEQFEYVKAAVATAGLEDRITVLQQDYRELRGTYDKLVSIEMIEAVGWRDLGKFLHCCSSLLAADGEMLLQGITIDDRAYLVERSTRTFITEYVFPGGSLPSLGALISALGRRTDLVISDIRDLTTHYVRTLQLWRERFESNSQALRAAGYDARFQRLWRLYLAYCEGGFAARRINCLQITAVKPRFHDPSSELSSVPGGVSARR